MTSAETTKLKEYINDELIIRKRHYAEAPTTIVENYENELKNIEEYNGRQLFEMIQNADDASVNISNKNAEVYVELTENKLIIANNGDQFSIGGIKSLIYSDVSPKKFQSNVVGNKGLGFRSILSWASEVLIHSYDFHVGFSREYANSFLDELTNGNVGLSERLKKESQQEYPIAILRCPQLENIKESPFVIYDTVIEITLKQGSSEKIEEQLIKLKDPEILIFLNNLESICVNHNGNKTSIRKEVISDQEVKLFSTEQIEGVKYTIKQDKGIFQLENGETKGYDVKIAYNETLQVNAHKLYSYFQTDIPFPFPVLAHATFELTSDRKRLTSDTIGLNNRLQVKLAALMVNVALSIAAKRQTVDYTPLMILSAVNEDLSALQYFKEELNIQLKTAKIFPTISGEFKSFEEGVYAFTNKDYTSFFSKENLPLLLNHTNDINLVSRINNIGIKKPTFEILKKMFESNKVILDPIIQAQLIQNIKSDYSNNDLSELRIFFNDKNELIPPKSKIFLPPTNNSFKLPEGLEIQIIDIKLNTSLKTVFNVSFQDSLEEHLNIFEVKAYRLSRLLKSILSYYETNIINENGLHLIQFLFEIYQKNSDDKYQEDDLSFSTDLNIPLKCRTGLIKTHKDLYFGKEYNGLLCEQLYSFNQEKFVASSDVLGLQEYNFEKVKEFLQWLGVAGKPRYNSTLLSYQNAKKYIDFVFSQFDYKSNNIGSLAVKNYIDFISKFKSYESVKVFQIDDIETILLNTDNEIVLYWLKHDETINGILASGHEKEGGYIKIKLEGSRNFQTVDSTQFQSYIFYLLSNLKWLDTKTGTKSKPINCSISKTVDSSFAPFIEIPKIDYKHNIFIKNGVKHRSINVLLKNIGVVESFGELPTENLYNILMKLESLKNKDPKGKKAKAIYLEIAENGDLEFQRNEEIAICKSFLQNGKVWARKDNIVDFVSISEPVYYIQDNIYGEEILKNFWCIEIPKRRSTKNISHILGINPLKDVSFKVTDFKEHSLHYVISKELKQLTPFIYGFRCKTDENGVQLNKLKSTKIVFCCELNSKSIQVNSEFNLNVKPYEFVESSETNTWYVLLPKDVENIDEFKATYRFTDAIAEIYSSILKVGSIRSNIRELIKLKESERQDYFVRETDDQDNVLLSQSRLALDEVDSYKSAFWKSITIALNIPFDKDNYEQDHTKFVVENLLLNNADLVDFESQFQYKLKHTRLELKVLCNFFNKWNIDFEIFNKNFQYGIIDLIDFHNQNFEQTKYDNEYLFRDLLFEYYGKRTIVEKKHFLENWDAYRSLSTSFSNNLEINYLEKLTELVLNRFGVNFKKENSVNYNFAELYSENLEKFRQDLLENCIFDDELFSILQQSLSKKSLIYFDETEQLFEDFKNLKTKSTISAKDIPIIVKEKPTKIDFEITDNSKLFINEATTSSFDTDFKSKGGFGGGGGGISDQIRSTSLEEIGARGEFLVYQALKLNPKNIVEWVSEIGRKYNKSSAIGSDKHHYDLRYKNDKSEWRYVEVKSSIGSISSIVMTIHEVKFGEQHPEFYDVFFVEHVFGNYKITASLNFFEYDEDENFNENKKFSIDVKQYNLKFKFN